jgi:hypothetical protein
MPNGIPGAIGIVGLAAVAVTLSGWNPRGTKDGKETDKDGGPISVMVQGIIYPLQLGSLRWLPLPS